MNNDLLDNVSKLSMEYGSKISLCATGELFGIHHGEKDDTGGIGQNRRFKGSSGMDKGTIQTTDADLTT